MRAIGLLVLTAMLVALGVAGPPPVAATTDLTTRLQIGVTPAALDIDAIQAAPTDPRSTCLPDNGSDVTVASRFYEMKSALNSNVATRAAPAIAADARHYFMLTMEKDAHDIGAYAFTSLTAQEIPASVPYAGAG